MAFLELFMAYLELFMARVLENSLPFDAPPPSLIVSDNDYLLSATNLSEPQYALPNAAYPP